MKTTIPLDVFQKYILPDLRRQFTGDALQSHVSENFTVTEGGAPVDIRFTGHQQAGDISSTIQKAVDAYARSGIQHKTIRTIGGGDAGGLRISGRTQFFKGADAKEKATRWGMWALAAF